MKFSEVTENQGFIIQAYFDGEVIINNRKLKSSLIITPRDVLDDWRPKQIEDLQDSDFEWILATDPEVVLVGTGLKQQFPPVQTYASLIAKGIGVEIMDTAAACRTYNILLSEGRQVAAALII